MSEPLPPFPVDDVTLDAIEHSLGHYLTEGDEDGPGSGGADYSLDILLDFYSGTMDDPEGVTTEREIQPGIILVVDPRPHYTISDVIESLIAEVRRLRNE